MTAVAITKRRLRYANVRLLFGKGSSLASAANVSTSETPPGDVVIAAHGIGKVYGHVRALHDVSFELHRSEVVAIFGDNGAGKSTLAKCLCGVVVPDTGHLEVASHRVEMHSIRDAERYGITAVHQDLALAPDLTVLENMFLGREVARPGIRGKIGMIARGAMARESEKALAALQIKLPSVRVPVAALSGGQKQAVAVARASMWSTTGILMDEPTAALGTRQSDVVCELIRRTADGGLGVMVISHDLPAASSRSPTASSCCATAWSRSPDRRPRSPGATSSTRWWGTTSERGRPNELPDGPSRSRRRDGPADETTRTPTIWNSLLSDTAVWILAIDVILVIVFGFWSPQHTFWSVASLQVIALDAATALILAVGISLLLAVPARSTSRSARACCSHPSTAAR